MDPLNVISVTNKKDFHNLQPMWNDLLSRSDMDIPFMTFEWFSLWWEMFGSGLELLILLVQDQEQRTIAIAPFVQGTMRLRGVSMRTISLMANYYTPRAGFVVEKQHDHERIMDEIMAYLCRIKPSYDVLYLDFVVKDTSTDNQVRNWVRDRNARIVAMSGPLVPYIAIGAGKDWDSYFKGLSKKFRGNISHKWNVLKRAGTWEIVRYCDSDTERAIHDVMDISRRGWKHAHGVGMTKSDRSIRFHTKLIQLLSAKHWLDISVLKLNAFPIAFVFNWKYKGILYGIHIGYDDAFRSMSAGRSLMMESLKSAFDEKLREVDLMGENDPYKMELTSTCRTHVKYYIFGDTVRGLLVYMIEMYVLSVVKKMLQPLRKVFIHA